MTIVHTRAYTQWFDAGSIGSARNLEALKKRGITHVLNASPIVPRFHKKHFSYLTVHVYDDPEEDIARFFHQATCFIARVRPMVTFRWLLTRASLR